VDLSDLIGAALWAAAMVLVGWAYKQAVPLPPLRQRGDDDLWSKP
jgi:hypothetical protein